MLALGCGGTAGELFDEADASALAQAGRGSSLGGDGPVAEGGSGAGSAGGVGSSPTGTGAAPGVAGAGGGGLGTGGAPAVGSGAGGSGAGGAVAAGGEPGSGAAGSGAPGAGDPGAGGSAGGAAGEGEPGAGPPPCDDGPFGEPELVTGLGLPATGDTFGPAPSADGLTLFFSSRGEQEDIFSAARSGRVGAFGVAALVPNINDPLAADGTPFISADDRSLYFFSDRPDPDAPGDRDLWRATRADAGQPFSAPALVPGVNTPGLEHLPRLTADGLALLFVSGRATVNLSSNIWQATRATPSGEFSTPLELPGVNSDSRDEGFWLSADGLTVFFASNRVLDNDMDIWVATRGAVDEAFGEPENLAVVNTASAELDPAITLDGFELFFASNRGGRMQLYRSTRICD